MLLGGAKALDTHLTWEEKVGQMMIFGFHGDTIPAHIIRFIKRRNLGGTILFPRNITSLEQVKELNNELQKLAAESPSKADLLIAIDQEGGVVNSLVNGINISPGNMALGISQNLKWVETVAAITGEELRALGFNMNLAPVVDVNMNPNNQTSATRSFGPKPRLVEDMVVSAIKGYKNHILTVGKHFPGYGDIDSDYQLHTPVINHEWERLSEVELAPFGQAIRSGVDAILVTHVFFPAIEKNPSIPASLSQYVLSGLLREQLGFQGLIIADCLEYRAIMDRFSPGEAAVLAIAAGVDIILIGHSAQKQEEVYRAVIEAVRSGRISMSRVDQTLERIQRAKKRLAQSKDVQRRFGKEVYRLVNQEIVKHALDVVQEGPNLPILIAEAEEEEKALDSSSLVQSLEAAGFSVEVKKFALAYTQKDKDKLISMAKYRPLVIFLGWKTYENQNLIHLIDELTKASQHLIAIDTSHRV